MKTITYIFLLILFITGCSLFSRNEGNDESTECIDNTVYIREGTSEPLNVPDDLDPYDYSDALQIPEAAESNQDVVQPCLELPPVFE
jgi:hypothetical protein